MSVAKLLEAATRVHEGKSGASARAEPSQYAQHYFALVRRVYKGNPSKLKSAAEYEQAYMKNYSITDLDLQADGSSVWARDLPKPMDGVHMRPGDHVRVVKATKKLGLSAGAVGVIKRVEFWFQGLYDVDFQFAGKPELVRARVYAHHTTRGTFQVLAADAASPSDSTIGTLARFDGDPKYQGAPKTEGASGGRALTPFAKAYFKLWRSLAGMGELDDVDAMEKQYRAGELTDADLMKNAPKSWHVKLPKMEAAEDAMLAVGDGVKVTKGSKGLGIEKGWGGKVRAITPDEGGSAKLEIYFRDGKTRVLWVRHMNRLKDAEFSVNRGDPTQSVMLTRIPAGQPVPGFATAKKTESVLDEAARLNAKYAASAPQESSFGFAENLAADIELEKLLGHNFIDDGSLLESDGQDPGTKVRAQLAKMDALALEIRKGLNGLVREGIGMVEEASRVDLGEGTESLASMKPVLGRLLAAYTELVAGLQQARESVGYDVQGASVTSVPDESEMQERITKRFARRAIHGFLRESAAGGADVYAALAKMQPDPIKCDELAQNVSIAFGGLADALLDALHDVDLEDVKKSLKRHINAIPKALHKSPALHIEELVGLVVEFAKDGDEGRVRAEAKRLRQVANEIRAASYARIAASAS